MCIENTYVNNFVSSGTSLNISKAFDSVLSSKVRKNQEVATVFILVSSLNTYLNYF